MSTHSNPSRPALPPAAVDRVFARLDAIFGVQRMAAAWGGVPHDERREVWGGAIGRAVWSPATQRYDLDSIGAALDELAGEATPWPPSCGEFADRCARFAQRPGRNLKALPVPKRTDAEIAAGREQMDRIRGLLRRAVKPMPTDDAR